MRWITRFRLWFWRWRRRKEFERWKGELREFVYLDEVSIYSLIASRLGPIAVEFTETQAKTLEREFSGSLGADSGVIKAEINPRKLDIQTRGSQVLRKSTVQTTFKELYDFEFDSLAFKPISEDTTTPKIRNQDDFINETKALEEDKLLIDPTKLTRGKLLDVEVKLEAEPIFHISTFISIFREIFEESNSISSLHSYDFKQVKEIEHILAQLLVGLVPIRGQAIDYKIIELKGKEWIVHRKLLNQIPPELLDSRPLFVVGVAEQSLFWKDIRRTLFSKAHYRVFCRIGQDNLQDSWKPVKLVQVLEKIVPDLAEQINMIVESSITSMTNTNTINQTIEHKERMRNALIEYARLLANHYNQNITPDDLSMISRISQENSSLYASQKERYKAFEAIATYLITRFNVERNSEIVANNREFALNIAGLDFSGQSVPLDTFNNPLPAKHLEQRLLDTEFIAIYW